MPLEMNQNVFITCAITGSGDTTAKSDKVPITPAEIAEAAIDAAKAGAAVVHCHVRNPDTGAPSRDPALFREVTDRIRSTDTDMVLNLTAGMVRKLRVISETAAYEGNRVMHKMLEHRWLEYKWSTIVKILQCAMDYAGVQQARASRKLKNCEENLLKMRTSETCITYTG